jgi:antitoxin ParD1/3/4
MPAQHTALTEPLQRYISEQVASGRYATASEVIRASLRLLIERDNAEIRRLKSSEQPAHD